MDLKEKTLKNEKSDSDEPDKLRSQFTPLSKEHSGASRSDEARTPKNELLVARPSTDKNVSSGTETSESEADTDAPDRFESAIGVTTVLDLLEDMSYQKKLSNIQAAHLKSKYLKLCSLLSRSRDNEFTLIQQAKQLTVEMERLKQILAKADNYPANFDSPADLLREQLLTAENRLLQQEERNDELSYELDGLNEEKKMLQRDYDRLPKEEETEKMRRQIQQSIDELRAESTRYTGEARQLAQSMRDASSAMNLEQKNVSEADEELNKLKEEFSAKNLLPLQYAKEGDKIQKQKEEAERLRDESIVEFERLRAELENLQACRSRLELEREKLGAQSAKKQRKIFDTQAQYDAVSLQLDLAQQKAAELALEKTEAELRLGHLASEASRVAEAIKRHTRLRDETLRMLKKSQHNVQACKDAVRFAQANCTEKKATCLNLKQLGRDRELVVKRKKLNQEVSKLKEEVIYRSKLSETEREELLKSIQAQSQLNFTLADLRVEVVELSRLAAIKADEREQKSRDFRTAESRYRRIKDEIRTKQLQIEDYERALHDIQRRLKDFAALYESIKEERNNCLTLIQYGHQRLQEISEKLRIRRNEVEILEDTLTQKTQQIERQRAKCTIIVNARNELRNQISKQACLIEDYEAERDKLQISIQSQNRVVQKNKEALAFIKDAMGRVIEIRNKRAVQMVERNEELCVLQEKLRLQELTLSKGETEFGSLNEQIKWLEQERVELIRSIEVCRRKNGKQKELEDELTSRQIQLAICEDQVANLSKAVVDPTAPMLDPETGEPVRPDVVKIDQTRLLNESSEQLRVRQVAGRERNPADLRMKIDGIQLQILNREKKLLEFDLLLQAVSRLVKKLQSQAGVEGDTTLQLAKTMNANYNQVQETNKELKASTAEMTMLMAMAFKLQRMVEKKREYVAECQRRIEAGETPSEELMLEWKRYMKRRKQKLIEDQEQTQDTDSDENWTTAPERPNAYVPEQSTAELVEIKPTAPLPYGAHPPFRPTTPGANMRHFRNPKQKELE